jgi:hypothetical protein
MATKLKDLAVKTGEYTKNGETKGRYESVGAIMESDDGGLFVLLKRTFNPAGVNVDAGRDMLLISAFDSREDDRPQQRPASAAPQREQRAERPAAPRQADPFPDDDIPF